MKFGISYGRKVRTRAYEILDISLYMEFDTGSISMDEAFEMVKNKVETWVREERDRILAELNPPKQIEDK